MNKPIAIVLGGTNPHKALIENLRTRGYYTLLIDYNENPPAKEIADNHIKFSTLDQEGVLSIAKSVNAELVISTCVDQANVTACYVSEKLGLPHPYKYETARQIANKIEMKSMLISAGIPTAKFVKYSRSVKLDETSFLEFPLVVKPADTGGAKGVRKVANNEELNVAINKAFAVSKQDSVIVEEFTKGDNVDAVCFISGGKAEVILLRQRFGIQDEGGAVLQYSHSLIPATISSNAKLNIKKVAQSIADTFNLQNTPMQLQLIVDGDNVSVIEFAPRIGGGLSFKSVKLIYGFDILDAAIDTYFGIPVKVKIKDSKILYSENNLYAHECVFERLEGLKYCRENGMIEVGYVYKKSGDTVNSDMTSRDRVGSFIVKGNSIHELKSKIMEIVEKIEIIDNQGNLMMNKEKFENLFVRQS